MGGTVTPMSRRQALGLAVLALGDQGRQPDSLPEFLVAETVLRRILRGERGDLPRREDLPVMKSNFSLVDPGI